jgi:preprotein translocase subunit SecY
MFQGTQKLMAILLSIIEAAIYVAFRAIPAQSAGAMPIVVAQLALGGVMVLFMDEVVSKYGFGSGIGIFIVAGVAKTIFIRAFNPLTNAGGLPTATNPPAGIIPYIATSIGSGEMLNAFIAFLPIIATLIVFFLVIYIQAIRVEIPLAFGSIRGFGRRWPLKFLYTSNIPVILIAAMLANVQLMARAVNNPWFGTFDSNGNATGGIMLYLIPPNNQAIIGLAISVGFFALMGAIILYFLKKNDPKIVVGMGALGVVFWLAVAYGTGLTSLLSISLEDILRTITYSAFMIGGSVLFSIFWVSTSGMDSSTVAEQIQSIGMQIPGYRRDERVIESVLKKYIPYLAVLGGAAVGFLAVYADLTSAIGSGTGILLSTMIIYQLYEQIGMQHMEDMNPAVRRFFGEK